MRCTKCGTESTSGKKFCAACGSPLSRRCANCGAENAPSSAYCEDCGGALSDGGALLTSVPTQAATAIPIVRVITEQRTATSILDGERKTVTALFADIKGSTELIEDLDPEEARAIVDPALKLMIDAVHRYDGYVVQSTGDGIFALFGAPVAHEDHPQRALYAALRLQEELGRYSAKVVAGGSSPIQGRVGINTGEVVVRSIQTGAGQVEYTPIGHTTNLASRMQTSAPVGSIAISEATRKLCEGYFILKPLGATRVKGVSEPVNIYEVTGLGPLRTRLQRAVGRGLTKFVGRVHEMEALRHAAEQAKDGHGQIVAAMAEPGVGKSRLYFEFKAYIQSGWMVLETFSISHGKASAYLPVIDLLRNYFDISPGDDERKRREKVTGRVVALDRSLEDTLPYLFSLLGVVEGNDPLAQMDGQIRKRRTLEVIKRILLRESLNQPLTVIFEDLHWVDEATQEFLNLLADSIGTAKVLLLVNYRPEYSHLWNSKTYYTQLHLDPLGQPNAQEMLSALLGDGEYLLPLKRLIIERTEGNPFFMEEMVQALFEEGALVRNGAVHLTRPLDSLKVPGTVQAILASRIDRLPPGEKDLLQTLAVMGREFTSSLLRQVVSGRNDDDLNQMLADLQMAEFIYEQPAAGDVEYAFKHALTQEVAYNALLIERRKQVHERAGVALESTVADRLDDHLEELAHHFSRSDNVQKAVEYLGRAGQQALQRSAYGDAINRLTTAIDLLQKLPEGPERIQEELVFQLAVGTASVVVKGGWGAPETERSYSRALELSKQLGDPPELFPVQIGLWAMHALRGELEKSYELAEQLLRRAQGTGEQVLLMYAQYALGFTAFWMGKFLSAREHLKVAISLYDPARDRRLALLYGFDLGVHGLSYQALTLWALGYPDDALMRGNQAIALAQAVSNPVALAFAEGSICVVRQGRRELHEAKERAESIIAFSAERGLTEVLPIAIAVRGWAMAQRGRYEDGITEIQKVLVTLRATGAQLVRTYILSLLAESYSQMGHLDHGQNTVTEILAAVDQQGIRHFEAETYRLKGELLLRQDQLNAREAHRCFERAIEIARKQSAKSWELRATMSLARLLDKQGNRDEARTMLSDIYGWFTEGFDTADLRDAKALLSSLSDACGL